KAFQATGRRTLYAVNLTGSISRLNDKARRLAKLGAQCFLFNVLSYGFGALEELRSLKVPILAHPALAGAIGASPDTGIGYGVLLGSLMRLGGADIVLFPSSYAMPALAKTETDAIASALRKPWENIKAVFPAPSAGIHPGLVPRILADYGPDVIINAGGGVHGHPQGARGSQGIPSGYRLDAAARQLRRSVGTRISRADGGAASVGPRMKAKDSALHTLVDSGRQFYDRRWMWGTAGNLSLRLGSHPLEIAITPSGLNKGHLKKQDLLVVKDEKSQRKEKGASSRPNSLAVH